MAAAAGKKESVSLSLLMEVNDLEVEEEVIHHGPRSFGRKAWWMGRWRKAAAEGVEEADSRNAEMETSERACRNDQVRNSRSWYPVSTVAHRAV